MVTRKRSRPARRHMAFGLSKAGMLERLTPYFVQLVAEEKELDVLAAQAKLARSWLLAVEARAAILREAIRR